MAEEPMLGVAESESIGLLGDESGMSAKSSSKKKLFLIGVVHSAASFLFGYDTAIISPAQVLINPHFGLAADTTPLVIGIYVAAIIAGCLSGAMTAGSIASRFGRLRALFVADFFLITFALLSSFSYAVWMLAATRFFVGVGVGMGSVVVPMLLAEIAPPDARGAIGTIHQLLITIGIVVAYSVGITGASWELMFGLGAVPAVLHVVLCVLVPTFRVESPSFLLNNYGEERCIKELMKLRGVAASDPLLLNELNVLKAESSAKEGDKLGSGDLLATPQSSDESGQGDLKQLFGWARRPFFIALAIQLFQQLTGINGVIYYLNTILHLSGLSDLSANIASIAIGCINVGVTMMTTIFIEKFGRRPLLIGGLSGMFVSLGVVACAFQWLPVGPVDGPGSAIGAGSWVAVMSLVSYIIFFAGSIASITWLITSEVLPTPLRPTAMSIATALNWSCALLVSLIFPTMFSSFGEVATFLTLAVISLMGVLFVISMVPETRGRSVNQVLDALKVKNPRQAVDGSIQ